MIQFPNTRIVSSVERAVSAGYTVDQEGKALVALSVGGVYGVKKSAGTSGEQFVGFSFDMLNPVAELAFNETLVQGTSNTVTLTQTPVGGTLLIIDKDTGTVQTAGAPANNNEYSISGKVVTLKSTQQGHSYFIAYRFAPTVAQVLALYGNVHPGGPAGAFLGQCGVITKGDVFTSEYDTAVDWTGANPVVKLGANGLLTTAGSGVTLTNVTVISAPGAGVGFLGIEVR